MYLGHKDTAQEINHSHKQGHHRHKHHIHTEAHNPQALSLSSLPSRALHRSSRSLFSPHIDERNMSFEVTMEINRHILGGYLKVVDALPHPEVEEICLRLHPDTINNYQIWSVLGLQRGGYHDIEVP